MRTVDDEPLIIDAARKHGIADHDILHAYRNAIRSEYIDDGLVMMVGGNAAGTPLEIGARIDREPVMIIHAMKARKRFLRKR